MILTSNLKHYSSYQVKYKLVYIMIEPSTATVRLTIHEEVLENIIPREVRQCCAYKMGKTRLQGPLCSLDPPLLVPKFFC